MRKIKVNVTQRDIDRAIKLMRVASSGAEYCGSCPVALSLRRHKGMKTANVGTMNIYLDYVKIAEIPTEIKTWIKNFDYKRPVTPFSFILEVPNER